MTSHALTLAPAAITRRLRLAGAPVLFSRIRHAAGVAAEVVCENDDDARACSAVLLQAGYETSLRKGYGQLTVTRPEPVAEGEVVAATVVEQDAPRQEVEGEFRETEHGLRYLTADEVAAERAEQPAGEVAYRKVGEGLYEVVLDGTAIGRVARTTPAHVTFGARWASYRTNGERIASGSTSRARAGERVVEYARFATVDADTITNRRDLLTAVEVQTRHLGYASAATYLQAPGREVTRARAEVAAYAPDGPAMPAGVGGCDCSAVAGPHLAHCDDCSAPADACVCSERDRLAVLGGYGLPAARAQEEARPRHYGREEVLGRLQAGEEFVLDLGPDDRAYDPETGDTLLGGVRVRYARGSFPGPSYTATILGDEPAVDDDPREQPRPLEWSEVAGS